MLTNPGVARGLKFSLTLHLHPYFMFASKVAKDFASPRSCASVPPFLDNSISTKVQIFSGNI